MEYDFSLTKTWVSSQRLRSTQASRLSLLSPLPVCVIYDEHSPPTQAGYSFQATMSHMVMLYAEPPLTTIWEQMDTIQPLWLADNIFSSPAFCIAAPHEVLLLFLSLLKCKQEENNNFIPKTNKMYLEQQPLPSL